MPRPKAGRGRRRIMVQWSLDNRLWPRQRSGQQAGARRVRTGVLSGPGLDYCRPGRQETHRLSLDGSLPQCRVPPEGGGEGSSPHDVPPGRKVHPGGLPEGRRARQGPRAHRAAQSAAPVQTGVGPGGAPAQLWPGRPRPRAGCRGGGRSNAPKPRGASPDDADPQPQLQALPPIRGEQSQPLVTPLQAQERGLSSLPPFWVPPALAPRPANLGPKNPSISQGERQRRLREATGTKRVFRWGWMAY
ncbi:hypothetical protein NDU88_002924 [Pleurodeles waltl]|uniref:Uncharacterized protein n=1 Tax=Pleurodeles waltl TaxID=8319 RepID=A0AAV7T515_PLEWA|nr:hypothetical protein NDU88_002924 [Pleurodeles waltl]